MLGTTATDCSTIIMKEFADSLGITPEEVRGRKEDFRERLFEFGKGKQKDDPGYFVRECLKRGWVVSGVRPKNEFDAVKSWFQLVIYVHGRTEPGSTDPLTVDDVSSAPSVAVIKNDGSLGTLMSCVENIMEPRLERVSVRVRNIHLEIDDLKSEIMDLERKLSRIQLECPHENLNFCSGGPYERPSFYCEDCQSVFSVDEGDYLLDLNKLCGG
jgi:hypothetical protein